MAIHRILAALLSVSHAASALAPLGQPAKTLTALARERHIHKLGGTSLMSLDDVDQMVSQPNSTITKNWVDLPIDHFAECSDTFRNRYYVQEEYYQPGGPVFIYDVGEESASYSVGYLKANNYFTRLLKEFNGMGIAWEHRYYGQSYPSDNMTWLTIEQALADMPAMAANFSRPNFPSVDLTPASTPWVFTGGSYPGVRAAMSRLFYPDTFYAAWAASAPVQMQVNMSVYFEPVLESLKVKGYSSCIADCQAGTNKMDHLLNDETTAKQIKKKWYGDKAASWSNYKFANRFTQLWYSWSPAYKHTFTGVFCDFLETDAQNNTAPPEGWAPTKGADWMLDHMFWANNKTVALFESELPGGEAEEDSVEKRDSTHPRSADRSWNYQACTQFGYQQGSAPGYDHWIPNHYSLRGSLKKCHEDFPEMGRTSEGVRKINEKTGGWNMRPSNTFWTADEWDSWRLLSPLSSLAKAPAVNASIEIPACGAESSQSEIFGYVLPGRDHCDEFFDTSDVARYTQDIFTKALKTWLPCFQKSNGPTYKGPPTCAASK